MKKKLFRSIAHSLPQTLLLISILTSNVLFPASVIAQEVEAINEANTVTQEETVPIDTSEDILKDGISTSIYEQENIQFENGIYTVNNVIPEEEYIYPENDNVRVKFTEVTQEGNLIIKRVELTQEQKELLNTKDNYGWDITSNMENGTFKYDLTLPNVYDNTNVEVKYTEDGNNYESIEEVSNINNSNIVIEGLDHFTLFVIVDDGDSGYTDNGWTLYSSGGYKGDHKYVNSNQTDKTATWKYSDSDISKGAIYLSWTIWDDHATNATYTSSITTFGSQVVNQQKFADQSNTGTNGTWSGWYRVPSTGSFNIPKNSTVTLSPISGTDGNLSADAVAFVDLNQAPNEVWVDDNYTSQNNTGEHFWGYNAFNKIQDGIDAVASGGTVYVASGTYAENPNLNKSNITLYFTGGQNQTTLYGTIYFSASYVTVKGYYTITGDTQKPTTPSNLSYTINGNTLSCGSYTNVYDVTANWSASTDTESGIDHYEYQSFNPTTGWIWPDENGLSVSTTYRQGTFSVGEGTYGFRVRAVDKVGNKSDWSSSDFNSSCKITYDKTGPSKPTITNSPNNSFTNVNAITINWNGGDDQGTIQSGIKGYILRYVFSPANGESNIDWSTGLTTNGNPKIHSGIYGHGEGKYEIFVKTVDNAGNESLESSSFTITYDITAPTGSITSIYYPDKSMSIYSFITNDNTPILEGICSNTNIDTVKLTIDKDTSNIQTMNLQCNGDTWRANPTTQLLDGEHTATLIITDKAGNTFTTTEALFIDTKAPFATHTYYKNGTSITDTKTFVKAVSELSFIATYTDDSPSSGILKDSYVIFDSNEEGTARTDKAYCTWRDSSNTVIITENPLTTPVQFTNCEPTLLDGQYFMYHQVYDNATRQDIPTITQYRDVKGLYFIVDTQAPTSAISITGNLAETKGLNHNNGWHGKGWYHDFAEVKLYIPTTSTLDSNEKIQYEILDGDVSCSDTLTSLTVVDNGANISSTINSLSDGVHTLCYQAKDSAGNLETVKKELLKLDRTLPTYEVSKISGNNYNNVYYINSDTISFKVKGADTHSGYYRTRYDTFLADDNWNCTGSWTSHQTDLPQASNSSTQTLSVSGLADGKYCLKVWIYDDVQNKAWADTNGVSIIHFVIDNAQPQGEIRGIRYDSQDIVDYFVTNNNTPKLFGTCSDTNIDIVKLTYGTNEQTLTCNNGNWEAEMTQLSDGLHTVTLTITDKAGNQTTDNKEITIDTVAPTAQYTYYKNGTKITDSKTYISSINELTYTGIFEDKDSSGLYKDVLVVFRKSDNHAYCSWSQSLSSTGGVSLSGNSYELTTQQNVSKCVNSLPEGEYYIRHRVYDNAIRRDAPAYHQHRQYTTLEFVIDSTAPTVEITSPSENSILRGTVEIKGSVQDTNPHHYYYKIEDKDGSIITDETVYTTENITDKVIYTWDTTKVDDGTYKIQLEAKDAADNKDASSIKSITVIVDNKAPTTTLTSDPSGTYINTPVSISGKSIDTNGVDSVNIFYRVTGPTDWTLITTLDNSSKDSPYDWSYTWTPSSDGTYDIKISATDTVGNIEQSAYIYSLTYDSTAPTITLFSVVSNILNISATDLLSGTDKIEVKIDNGEWITYTTDMNLNTLLNNTPGTYTIYAIVTDKAGNTTQVSTTYTIPTPAVLGATTTTTKTSVKGTTTTKTTPNISENTQTEEILKTTSIEEPSVLGERCENKKKVSGYVYIDKNEDKEMNNDEKGIKEITLTIQYTDEQGNIKTEEEVTTDEKGYWETQLCSGKYNIVVKEDTLPKNIEVPEVLSLTVSDNEKETIFNIQALDTRNFWQKYWYLIVGGLAIIVIGYTSIKSRKKEEI